MSNIPDLNKLTVKAIKDFAVANDIKPPNGLVKAHLIQYVTGVMAEKVAKVYDTKRQVLPYADIVPVSFNKKTNWLKHLRKEGWAVVPIKGWQDSYVDTFMEWFEDCCENFDRNDKTTWTKENLPIMSYGILKHHFGQTELQWSIRELCLPIFAKIWGVDEADLLCSFDGGCFIPPIEIDENDSYKHWFHVDQHREDTGFSCIQGIVNFVDNGPNDGGLLLVEKSMDVFNDYMNKHPSYGLFWKVCDMKDSLLSDRRILKICALAGHMALFDSRMFHANTPPTNTDNYRMCTYVAMQPREGATDKELAKRIKLYEEGRMSNHWCKGIYFVETAKDPYNRGKPYNKPSEIEVAPLNEARRRMVGY